MQMVTLGTLSLSGEAGILAMRRKLLAVAQRLGVNSIKATRLAAAASDHAKDATRKGALDVLVGLSGSGSSQELYIDFAAPHSGDDTLLRVGFDRVEPLVDGQRRGWRAYCKIDPIAMADPTISWCQAVIAEQGVEELVEALHANNQALQTAKEAEEGARARLVLLLSVAPSVIYSRSATGNFRPTFVGESITRLFDVSPEEYFGNPDLWRERVHPDDFPRIDAWIDQIFQSDKRSIEYRYRRRDGTYCWVNDEQHVVRDEEGKPVEIVGSWTDITARKEAEDAKEGARARLSLLLGAAPVVVYSFRASGDFAPTFVSDSIQGMLGYRPDEYLENADFWRSCVQPPSPSPTRSPEWLGP
jgi:PAS domain S-box-containing protein